MFAIVQENEHLKAMAIYEDTSLELHRATWFRGRKLLLIKQSREIYEFIRDVGRSKRQQMEVEYTTCND